MLTAEKKQVDEYNKFLSDTIKKEKNKDRKQVERLPDIERLKIQFTQKEIRYKNVISGLLKENKNLEESIIKLSQLKQKGRVLVNLETMRLLCKYMYEVEQQTEAYIIYDNENFVRLDNVYYKSKDKKQNINDDGLFYVDD